MSPLFKKDKKEEQDWFIPEDGRKQLQKVFEHLVRSVQLVVFTEKGTNDAYNEYMLKFVRDMDRLSDKITAQFHDLDSDAAKQYGVSTSPVLLLNPDQYHVRFLGAPLGEEGRSFVEALILVSTGDSGLSKLSKAMLAELHDERHVRVFVNPGCPYCPGQVVNAFRTAVEKPLLVKAECVETTENPELAIEFNVGSVPQTVINDHLVLLGLEPQERFVAELVSLKSADELLEDKDPRAEHVGHVHDHEHEHHHEHEHNVEEKDLVIVGAGPAGLTAAIYAERSGLSAVVLEKAIVGGQVALTPVVENYPGFANVPGKKLMDIMSEHAREYADIREGEEVREIKVGRSIEVYTNHAIYVARALLLCTGATWRKLGAPGEDRYFGFGVNYCASCDGYLYKGRKVFIAGGGNTALTDALHLKNLGVDISIVHRRDSFRAEQHLQEAVQRSGIPVLWNTVVEEILGDESRVTGVRLRNTQDDSVREEAVDGVFVAVGLDANTELATQIGLKLTRDGYIEVDRGQRTNIPRIYAAGDVTGGVQQIVTAIGEGSTAALSAFEDLANPYWLRKGH